VAFAVGGVVTLVMCLPVAFTPLRDGRITDDREIHEGEPDE
jgi:hypothetical protein